MARRRQAGLHNSGSTGKVSRQTRQSSYSQKDDRKRAKQYVIRGINWQRRGKDGEAVAFYDRAIEADPTYVAAYTNKGEMLAIAKRYGEALVCLGRTVELAAAEEPNKDHVGIYTDLAGILDALGRHDGAVNCLKRDLRCIDNDNPNDPDRILVSRLFEMLGEKERSEACQKSAINSLAR